VVHILQDVNVSDQTEAAAAGLKPGSDPASQRKTAAQKKMLVNEFLKRKAEEQRKAARDFLKSEAAQAQDECSEEPPAKVQCTQTGVTTTAVPQGVVRQKVYSSSQQISEAYVAPSEITVVQAVQGGVIRGKSYRRAG
jgi:transcription termination factor Rho